MLSQSSNNSFLGQCHRESNPMSLCGKRHKRQSQRGEPRQENSICARRYNKNLRIPVLCTSHLQVISADTDKTGRGSLVVGAHGEVHFLLKPRHDSTNSGFQKQRKRRAGMQMMRKQPDIVHLLRFLMHCFKHKNHHRGTLPLVSEKHLKSTANRHVWEYNIMQLFCFFKQWHKDSIYADVSMGGRTVISIID